jgi:hypothetical protein
MTGFYFFLILKELKLNNKFFKSISSEWVLGVFVALLSVLIAAAAYQGSLFDSKESDNNVAGQKQLSESNTYYLEANQFVIYDYNMYDGWYINEGSNDELADYYKTSFSDQLNASMDREDGPFDDQYYTDMYADADSYYQEALDLFDQANAAGDKADQLQLVVLIYAVGLALSAYGSMLSEESKVRIIFALGSIVALIFGSIIYITTLIA